MISLDRITNYFVLDRYIRIVLSSNFKDVKINSSGCYNFRCNICKDSKKSKKKKRAWILKPSIEKPAMFKCWNCEAAIPAEVWLKRYFPGMYSEYIKDCLEDVEKKLPSVTPKYLENKKEEESKIDKERKDVKSFVPILEGQGLLFEKAIDFCKSRKVPDEFWKKFYVALDGKYAERLIIPFYNDKNQIYYFQGRTLTGKDPKYLNRTENKEDSIFNIYNIDATKPVIVLEGPIDSMFVNNSVAVLGLDFNPDKQKKLFELDCHFILDNDDAGKKKSKELLFESRKVFLWNRFLEHYPSAYDCKDINDLVLKLGRTTKFSFEDFKNPSYWGNSIFDAIYL